MKKYSMLLFIVGLAILLYSQQKIIMPFVYKVIQSDLFLVDSKDRGGQKPISTPLTAIAFSHCNTLIKEKIANTNSKLPEKPINVWSLGGYQFVVNGEISINNGTTTRQQKYVCRITYNNGDNMEGISDFANWSVDGLSDLKID